MQRCRWVAKNSELYKNYHDHEWGVPKYDDHELFELLVLESFQAGLSWLTVLRKREAFRKAFDNFELKKVAAYDENKIAELLGNKDIIRSRGKIAAAINNAKIFMQIQSEFGSFSNYIWGFSGGRIIRHTADIPTTSELSDKISADLRRRGMKYVGSIIIYSYLQAIGMVNDHEENCFCSR